MLEKKKALRKIIKVRVSAISPEERRKREEILHNNLFSMPEFLSASSVLLFANLPDEIDTFSLIDKCFCLGKKVFLPVINGDDMTVAEFTGEYKTGRFGIKEPVTELVISVQTSGEPSLLELSRRVDDRQGIMQPEITSVASNFRSEELGVVLSLVDNEKPRRGSSLGRQVSEEQGDDDACIEMPPIDFALIPGVGFSPSGYRLGRGKGFYDKFLSKHPLFTVGVCFQEQFFLDIPFEPHDVPMNKMLVI